MNGFRFTTINITFALIFFSSLSLAAPTNDKTMYHTQVGCMMCHQGEPIQTDKKVTKNKANPPLPFIKPSSIN